MKPGRMIGFALTVTALVLVTIWLLNRIPFTRQFVSMALS